MERIGQAVIRYGNCGYENNTDLVGAINIKTKKYRNKLLDEIEMEYRRKKRKKVQIVAVQSHATRTARVVVA